MTENDERESFEQWFKGAMHLGGKCFVDHACKRRMYRAWQASRETIQLDIDWPEANDDYWKDGEEGAYARGHEDGKDKTALAVRKALADAGIKVNP